MNIVETLVSAVAFRTGMSPAKVKLYGIVGGLAALLALYLRRNGGPRRGPLVYSFQWDKKTSHAGLLIGESLKQHGVEYIFTLCGGHISPILIGCKKSGVKVIDMRSEANAAFAADCVSRLTGIPGVCAGAGVKSLTAGPGLSNTITAVKNAQLAQTPMILFGGATSDLLKGRHSLQDIDQFALLKPHCKWTVHISRVQDIVPNLELAFYHARSGTPGPVFIEFPIDILYNDIAGRNEINKLIPRKDMLSRILRWGIGKIFDRMFSGLDRPVPIHAPMRPTIPLHSPSQVKQTVAQLKKVKRPMLVLGSQTTLEVHRIPELVAAVKKLGMPVWLQGMCRGLLGAESDIYIRNNRGLAFSKSDCIIICGVPFDFRTGYGLSIPLSTFVVAVNRDKHDLHLNRDMKLWMSPSIAIHGDPCAFIIELARSLPADYAPQNQWGEWLRNWVEQDQKKNAANAEVAAQKTQFINPVKLCQEIDKYIADDSILIGDGGDFVATVAYNVRARQPLSWLDPGLYGTLGIGAGFAIASKLVKPNSEVWLFWGDGASGYSIIEFDTLRRQGLAVIAVVGNDAAWMQIYRGQMEIFNDDTGCTLEYTNYHEIAKALGCEGFEIDSEEQIGPVVQQAKALAAAGKSVLINAKIGKTEFRKGSMSF